MKSSGPIVITGFMGCGKTEVARALAARLGVAMIDLDQHILGQHGRTAAQLIVEDGEPAFRAIETSALSKLLEKKTAGVIALGGGAWITAENRRLIDAHGGLSVWLDVPFDICWQRIAASSQDRPLGRTREEAEERYRQRRTVYQMASIHLAVMAHEHLENVVARLAGEVAKALA